MHQLFPVNTKHQLLKGDQPLGRPQDLAMKYTLEYCS